MNIIGKLSLRHLALNRKRTAITVIGIALSVAMVTAIAGMIVSFRDLLYRDSVDKDGLWHVRLREISPELAEAAVREPYFLSWEWKDAEEGVTLLLTVDKPGRDIHPRMEEICLRLGIPEKSVSYHNNLLIALGIVPGPYYDALYGFASILIALVAIASVLVISNAFSISTAERSRQFGLLKSAGATNAQIRDIVLFEGLVLTALSIPLGIAGGLFAQWVALTIANGVISKISAVNIVVAFRVVTSLPTLALAAAAALVTVLLAAALPARRASAISPVEAIRQSGSVKISPKKVKTSRLTVRLFGLEGMLASKTMKRNRSKYRTTVISLAVSIVLFIGVSSFGEILLKATSMIYTDYGTNLSIQLRGRDEELQNRLADEIASWEAERFYTVRAVRGITTLPQEALTSSTVEYFGAGQRGCTLFSIGQEDFEALCAGLRLDPSGLAGAEIPGAILVNSTGTYIKNGTRISFTPFSLRKGDVIPAVIDGETVNLVIAGEIREVIPAIAPHFSSDRLNLIVPDGTRRSLQPPDQDSILNLGVFSPNSHAFERRAKEYLSDRLDGSAFYVYNYEAQAENNRNIGLLVLVFVYGFIALLSLIGVTNVITTISTSVALRRREFAMLKSVGMTQSGVVKMLNYESMLYGIKSLAFGIPLGLLASFLMHRAMAAAIDFEYIFPASSILISIAAVLALTFSSMAFARSRQGRDNIVGTLRDEIT